MINPQTELPELQIHEMILPLALDSKTGAITSKASQYYKTLMGAAILTELLVLDRIVIEESKPGFIGIKKEGNIKVISSEHTGNIVLDLCLDKLIQSKHERAASY